MCGICGIVSLHTKHIDPAWVDRMNRSMIHRGPDSSGTHRSKFAHVGVRRLRIIDLATGDQPIHNENKNIWIVFNGEIYNFQSLRLDLIKRGHRFTTGSDTEVIVHLYEEFGLQFARHLNGMFAIAVVDEFQKRVVLVRDRIGKKPLYYIESNGFFIFASEIKSILASGLVQASVCIEGLKDYLALQYVPGPNTMFEGVYKLKPGTMLVIDSNLSHIEEIIYWQFEFPEQSGMNKNMSLDAYAEELRFLVEDSVRLRMISDVPVGVFLSGGIDSSIVAGQMARQSTHPVKSFTIGFPDAASRYDELDAAAVSAAFYRTDHKEIECSPERVMTWLPHLVWHLDEPIAEPLIIPSFLLCQASKREVTVALTGEGVDELFFGYHYYKLARWYRSVGWIPYLLRRTAKHLSPLPRYSKYDRSLGYLSGGNPIERIMGWNRLFHNKEIAEFLNKDPTHGREISSIQKSIFSTVKTELNQLGLTHQAPWFDTVFRLPYFILERTDKMSMAVSLETRSPFLDYRIVEFAARLPDWYKFHGRGKHLLRHAFRELLPPSIVTRRKKAFAAPITDWVIGLLRTGNPTLASTEDGVLEGKGIIKLFNTFRQHPSECAAMVWAILVFDQWYRLYIRNETHEIPSKENIQFRSCARK